MIVVADTTPLNYLILIDRIEVLRQLFERVLVPSAVVVELTHPRAPHAVRLWAAEPPGWLEIRAVNRVPDPRLDELHAGEREAIALAVAISADLLLVDERAARREAERCGLSVAGTLGVLAFAAERGIIDLPDAVDQLRRTSFRVSEAVLEALLERGVSGLRRGDEASGEPAPG